MQDPSSDRKYEDQDGNRYMQDVHIYSSREEPILEDHEPMINWKNVRSWLDHAPAIPPLRQPPPGFRLVDVMDKKVVPAPSQPFDYVCLSYVWGDRGEDLLASSSNIDELQQDNSLAGSMVPATIQDAMTACQHLGQRYLWVDRLCILQDDDSGSPQREKQAQIEKMGEIYHHAVVTLAAVEGTSVAHGLHGVSSRLPLKMGEDGMRVYFLRASIWAKRGWTFQEAILSRRLILFTAQDALLEDERDIGLQTTTNRYLASDYSAFHGAIDYREAIEKYTSRALSDPKDAINAFSGACNHLFGHHKFGLPMIDFDGAVCWAPTRLFANHAHRKVRRSSFPSWSWASTVKHVSFSFNQPVISVASWVFIDVDAHGNACMVYPKPRIPKEELVVPRRLTDRYVNQMHLVTMACQLGCMFMKPPHIQSMKRDFEEFKKDFQDEEGFAVIWPSYEEFWAACRGINLLDPQAQPSYLAEFSEEQRALATFPGRLLAASQIVSLSLRPRKKSDKRGADFIIHRDGHWIGICGFDDLETDADKAEQDVCFFALSVATSRYGRFPGSGFFGNFNEDLNKFDNVFEEQWSSFNDSMRTKLRADVMNVIAIEQRPEGDAVFRRLGFGIILLAEWFKLERERRSIVLE
ncbi:heterokaryon incompatibility protein-domain-containing protein [Phyllosticta citribraziliensis]|uniref:Heterokaryon incompatibility protein-domain-containing protein n=1 Tax=Phyllosticta citribraziliensis TaxID=989973 RepID=A0ABR1M357_9PEZI